MNGDERECVTQCKLALAAPATADLKSSVLSIGTSPQSH
jgi:hypothetical protein